MIIEEFHRRLVGTGCAAARFMRPDAGRFIRPDAARYLRPDWERYFRPSRDSGKASEAPPSHDGGIHKQSEADRFRFLAEVASLRFELAMLRLSMRANKALHHSNLQPRVPAGSAEGGQWTFGSGGGVSPISSSRERETRLAGAARGHHFVPRGIYRDRSFRSDTRSVFDKATTGPLRASRHGWSKDHELYNNAVGEHLDRFMSRNKLSPERMTPDQARQFLDEIKKSNDPRIRNYNLKIFRREIDYLIRRGPRRPD